MPQKHVSARPKIPGQSCSSHPQGTRRQGDSLCLLKFKGELDACVHGHAMGDLLLQGTLQTVACTTPGGCHTFVRGVGSPRKGGSTGVGRTRRRAPLAPCGVPVGSRSRARPGFLVRAEDRVTGRGSEGRGVGEARRWLRRGRRVPRGAPAADVSRPGPGFFFSSRGGDSPLQRHQPQRTLSRRLTGPLIGCTCRSRHGRFGTSGWTAVPGLVAVG